MVDETLISRKLSGFLTFSALRNQTGYYGKIDYEQSRRHISYFPFPECCLYLRFEGCYYYLTFTRCHKDSN